MCPDAGPWDRRLRQLGLKSIQQPRLVLILVLGPARLEHGQLRGHELRDHEFGADRELSDQLRPPGASAGGGAACRSTELRLSFVSGQGAAGTAYLLFSLTNAGARTCTMIGYPGFAVLDAQGAIVQHPARRGIPTPAPVKLLSLNPGQRARFIVTSSDVIPSPGCQHSYSGVTVQVYPPNQRAALRLSHPLQFCNLHVGAVQPAG